MSRAEDVLVLRNAGPKGAPGMPEAGYLPIPRKLAACRGEGHGAHLRRPDERHRVRHHRAARRAGSRDRRPAGAGADRRPHPPRRRGRRLDLLVGDAELAARRAGWAPPPPPPGAERGYLRLYLDQVLQADQGCDFAFCRPAGAAPVR